MFIKDIFDSCIPVLSFKEIANEGARKRTDNFLV
jgi:hypothetical protein